MEKKLKGLLILVLMLATSSLLFISQTEAAGNQGQAAGKPRVISVLGISKIQGRDAIVDILVVVPAGQKANDAAREALQQQGARPFGSANLGSKGFTILELVWDNLPVLQNYNPGSPKTEDEPASLFNMGQTALENTHATWNGVTTSSFVINLGGFTDRCPSLVRECRGRQSFDGENDVAWLKLPGNTLGVTWFDTSTDEADMALNINFTWNYGCVDVSGSFDVQTVFLHENGHVAGLGHSDDPGSVLEPFYDVADCDLGTDDEEGITFLYDSAITGSVTGIVTDGTNPIDGATVVLEGTNFSETTAADGTYTISNVPDPVTYDVTASKDGFESSTILRQLVDGVDGAETVDFVLTATGDGGGGGGAISAHVELTDPLTVAKGKSGKVELRETITVEDSSGLPVPNATVTMTWVTPNGTVDGSGTTNNSGETTFVLAGNAPNGSYESQVTDISGNNISFEQCTNADGTMDESDVTYDLSGGFVTNKVVVDECTP